MKKQRLKLTPEQSAKLNRDIKRLAVSGMSDPQISDKLGVNVKTISMRRRSMNVPANAAISRKRFWNDERDQFLMDNYHLGARYVANELGVSIHGVYGRVAAMGYASRSGAWEAYEDDFIKEVIKDAADKLERSPRSVARRFLLVMREGA